MTEPTVAEPLRPSDFYTRLRGGPLWTVNVSQRIGSVLAAAAYRRDIGPNPLSLANATIGVLSAVVAALLLPGHRVLAGLVVLVGFQLAFGFDCADGQLARTAKNGSKPGAVLDLVGDFVAQSALVWVIATAAIHARVLGAATVNLMVLSAVVALAGTFVGGLEVGFLGVGSYLDREVSLPHRVIMQVRDYGLQAALLGVALIIGVTVAAVVQLVITAVGLLFLLRKIAQLSRGRSTF